MKIRIIAVGKAKERFTKEWIGEFLKRMQKYASLEIIEQKEQASIEAEAKELLRMIKPDEYAIALDAKGTMPSSEDFAALLKQKTIEKNIVFVIGSDKGLSKDVIGKAHYRLSLSRMTFTHQIARLLLIEQIYRAFTIMKGERYHK